MQVQKPTGSGGLSLVLVTNEPFNGAVSHAPQQSVVALRCDDALRNEPCTISCSVQNLGSRGRYGLALVGFMPEDFSSATSKRTVTGVATHFDPSGDVFVAVEVWGIDPDGAAEKVSVIERPVQVRPVRDRIVLEIQLYRRVLKVSCNGSLNMFPNAALDYPATESGCSAALLCAGGKIAVKDLVAGAAAAHPRGPVRQLTRQLADEPTEKAQHILAPRTGGLPAVTYPELAERIESEILDRTPNVQWEDVAGLIDAKRLLNEAVILPALVPDLFRGSIRPWKGVLLFGPPGTGKTMLAKAVATSAKSTFFNMSSSTLLMKHFGESEKMVRTLFQLARHYSPSIIFFDEIDAIMSKSGDGDGGSQEVMRRVRAEVLSQMDGLHSSNEARVVVIATTNCPWNIDEALRRRLEKRIYIPLPDAATRGTMLKQSCQAAVVDPSVNFEVIGAASAGRSGADMSVLCREALMMPVRRLIEGKSPSELAAMNQKGEAKVAPATAEDFELALQRVQPSVGQADLSRFETWQAEFGSS